MAEQEIHNMVAELRITHQLLDVIMSIWAKVSKDWAKVDPTQY